MSSAEGGPGLAGLPREEAIPRLVDEVGPRLFRLASRVCGDPGDAEDIVQETFLQAWRKWDQFEGRSSAASWLFTIAARLCRRMHRRRAGEPARRLSLDELLPFAEPTMPDLEGGVEAQVRREAQERLEDAMTGLPLVYRLPLVLKEIAGLGYAEIASILGIRLGTAKSRVHRGRLELRKAVDRTLPRRPGTDPAYPRQVCLDLLQAKQEAMDRGVPMAETVVCERCRAVFASLDLTQDLCRRVAIGDLPADVRKRILAGLER
ncbi:MAG: RNA polymerase sigma factor [Planctomycetota bacterium]